MKLANAHLQWGSTPEPEPGLTAQFVEDAIDWIREHGWCQWSSLDRQGRVCAVGALARFQSSGRASDYGHYDYGHYDRDRYLVWTGHRAELSSLMGIPLTPGLLGWNDTPGRTEEEVIDALTKAAKTLREQGR
jgi:hypothetical protein